MSDLVLRAGKRLPQEAASGAIFFHHAVMYRDAI